MRPEATMRRSAALSGPCSVLMMPCGLGIADHLPFGPLEIAPGLGDLLLQESARIGRRLEPPLQARADEILGDPVGDLGRELRGFRDVAEPDQLPFFGSLDAEAAGDLAGRDLAGASPRRPRCRQNPGWRPG